MSRVQYKYQSYVRRWYIDVAVVAVVLSSTSSSTTTTTTMATTGVYQLGSSSTIPGRQWIWDYYEQLQTSSNVPIRLYDTNIRNRTAALQQLLQQSIPYDQDEGSAAGNAFLITDQALTTAEYMSLHRDTITTTTNNIHTINSYIGEEDTKLVQLPIMATSVSFYVNLPTSSTPTPIRMDGCLVAKIMSRTILSWDDPQILAFNPQLQTSNIIQTKSDDGTVSALPITVVVPELSSSASSVITKYLNQWCPSEFPTDYVSDVPPWVSLLVSYMTDDDTGKVSDNNNNNNYIITNTTMGTLFEEVPVLDNNNDTTDYYNGTNHDRNRRRHHRHRTLQADTGNDDNGSMFSSSFYFVVRNGTTKDVIQVMKAIPGSIGFAERPVVIENGLSDLQEIQLYNGKDYHASTDVFPDGIRNAVTRGDFPPQVDLDYNGIQFVTRGAIGDTINDASTTTTTTSTNDGTTFPPWPMVLVTYIILPKDLSKIIPNNVERSLLFAILEIMASTPTTTRIGAFESICCSSNNGGYVSLDDKIQAYVQRGIEILKNYPANNYTGSIIDHTNWIIADGNDDSNDVNGKFVLDMNRIDYDIQSRTRMKHNIATIQSNQKSYNNSINVLQGQITMLQKQVADLILYKTETQAFLQSLSNTKTNNFNDNSTSLSSSVESQATAYQHDQQQLIDTNTIAYIALIISCISLGSLLMLGMYWGWKRYRFDAESSKPNTHDVSTVMDDNDCVLCRYQRRPTTIDKHRTKNRRMFGSTTGCSISHSGNTLTGTKTTSSRSFSLSDVPLEEINSPTTTTSSSSSSSSSSNSSNNGSSSPLSLSPPPRQKSRQSIFSSYFGAGPPITTATTERRESLPGRQDDYPVV